MNLQKLFEDTIEVLFNGEQTIQEIQGFISAIQQNLNKTKIKMNGTAKTNPDDKAKLAE